MFVIVFFEDIVFLDVIVEGVGVGIFRGDEMVGWFFGERIGVF